MSDNTAQSISNRLHGVLDERLARAEAHEGYVSALETLKAVLDHADQLRGRGEHMMEYSAQVPEDLVDDIHDAGIDFTHRAQHLYRIVEEGMGDG